MKNIFYNFFRFFQYFYILYIFEITFLYTQIYLCVYVKREKRDFLFISGRGHRNSLFFKTVWSFPHSLLFTPPSIGGGENKSYQKTFFRSFLDLGFFCAPQTNVLTDQYTASAICVQRFDDSLSPAIHTTYRISLRSSSLREPRYPLLRVVFRLFKIRKKVFTFFQTYFLVFQIFLKIFF